MKDNIYGIEVEPEYVSFAGWVKDNIEVYMNHEGELHTPSMVLFNKDNILDNCKNHIWHIMHRIVT